MAAIDFSTVLPQTQQAIAALREDPWGSLRGVHPVEAAILIIIGVAFLVYGFRIYKVLVILAYAIVGLFVGAMVASAFHFNPVVGMIGGAIVLGLLAWPLYLVGWGLIGGAVMAGVGAMLAGMVTTNAVYQGMAAAVAGVLGIVLTILLMRTLVIIVTSIVGAAALIWGVLRLTLVVHGLGDPVIEMLQEKQWLQLVVVAVPAVVGMILQTSDTRTQGAGKPAAKKKDKKESDDKK